MRNKQATHKLVEKKPGVFHVQTVKGEFTGIVGDEFHCRSRVNANKWILL